jgi:hypothetical protein
LIVPACGVALSRLILHSRNIVFTKIFWSIHRKIPDFKQADAFFPGRGVRSVANVTNPKTKQAGGFPSVSFFTDSFRCIQLHSKL